MPDSDERQYTDSRERVVRAELSGLLEGPAFRTSKRCSDFLSYVVEQTLKGPNGSLKERSLGVELFQLPPDFDAGQHTVVRVTANEVRKKIAQHYRSENGTAHAVRIELPPGSYRAEFKWNSPAALQELPAAPPESPAESPESPAPLQGRRFSRSLMAGAAAIFVIACALSLWRFRPDRTAPLDSRTNSLSSPVPAAVAEGGAQRMIVGANTTYLDRSGRAWGPDRFFTGGATFFRPSEKILRTMDPDIYRHVRIGEFRYDIPLPQGAYELHLHFAETGLSDFVSAESSGEGQRVFRVSANGQTILDAFDVVADAAGASTSDERVFRDISPAADGFLHLNFTTMRGSPMVSAIEVLPVSAGKVRPIRIRAGWLASWQDSAGQHWQADSYFTGGNALVRNTNPAREGNAPPADTALYASERWGHFSYALPVAEGRYRVTLKFCEGHYGRRNSGPGGVGSRLFDIYCNGAALLRNFDIFKEAGGEGRPVDRAFSGIRPTAQGKIVLTFVPVVGMACVNGIEVIEESR